MQQTTKNKILSVVVEHIKRGANLDTLSLSTISKEAEIGKSTVYEHFDSKQTLIQETYYYLFKHYESIILQDLGSTWFKEAFTEQLRSILAVMKDAKIIMNAIMHNARETFPNFARETEACMTEMQEKINARFRDIMVMGVQEGIIDPKQVKPHTGYVMKAIISGLLYQYVNGEMDMTEEALHDLIYDQIVRMMN